MWLRLEYGSPAALATAGPDDLHEPLRPLGLWRRRADSLIKLARSWAEDGAPRSADEVLKRPGCGKYASDSWAIFMEGRSDVQPRDGKLNWYMERVHAGRMAEGHREVQP